MDIVERSLDYHVGELLESDLALALLNAPNRTIAGVSSTLKTVLEVTLLTMDCISFNVRLGVSDIADRSGIEYNFVLIRASGRYYYCTDFGLARPWKELISMTLRDVLPLP